MSAVIVTGASRGFGRAIAAAMVASGRDVVGIARDAAALDAVRAELGPTFTPLVGDATEEALAADAIAEHRPDLLVLNAGAIPHMAPVHEHSWESFSRNWHVDTKHAFVWTSAALRAPLAPGSVVVSMSSGAVLFGASPLSGGYTGANATIRYLTAYAAEEAERAGLGIRFVTLFPALTPSGIGSIAVDHYARRAGVDRETFIEGKQPVLTPDMVGKAVLEVAADPDAAAEYRLTGTGLAPV